MTNTKLIRDLDAGCNDGGDLPTLLGRAARALEKAEKQAGRDVALLAHVVVERDKAYDALGNAQTTVDMDLMHMRKLEAERDVLSLVIAEIRALHVRPVRPKIFCTCGLVICEVQNALAKLPAGGTK